MTDNNTVLPAGLHWLRASVAKEAASYGNIIVVHTQAVSVQRVMNGADAPPEGVLPAHSITAMTDAVPAISAVVQPFASQGYVPEETERPYLTRVSERLRHKHRPVQPWDYERLVLEKFPQIGLVKCVTYNRSVDLYDVPICPGEVVVVVVPKLVRPQSYVEPRVDESVLHEIAEYLRRYTTYFVRNLCVRNPTYEYIKIRAQVKFKPGTDSGPALLQVQDALNRYIVPWWYDTEQEVDLGRGVLLTDEVLNVMEQQPDVEYVTGFSIEHIFKKTIRKGDDTLPPCQPLLMREKTATLHALTDTARSEAVSASIHATTPWSVLVPLPKQPITVLGDAPWADPVKAQIGNLEIGTDFIVVASDQDAIPPETTLI